MKSKGQADTAKKDEGDSKGDAAKAIFSILRKVESGKNDGDASKAEVVRVEGIAQDSASFGVLVAEAGAGVGWLARAVPTSVAENTSMRKG